MKRLTVAAAALAAGMLTIVLHSQAKSDRSLSHPTHAPKASVTGKAKRTKAGRASDNKTKAKTASVRAKRSRVQRTKRGTMRIDVQETASMVAVQPDLKGAARKSAEGSSLLIDAEIANALAYPTIVTRYAEAYDVPVSLAHAVVRIESNYRPDKRGSAGEIGLMQIKPATARMMGYSGSVSGASSTLRPISDMA